jgi:hypothetical protein
MVSLGSVLQFCGKVRLDIKGRGTLMSYMVTSDTVAGQQRVAVDCVTRPNGKKEDHARLGSGLGIQHDWFGKGHLTLGEGSSVVVYFK